MTKHLGKNKNTNSRYAVVSMQLPDDEDHCLVVEYDSLPIRYQDALMNVLHSKDGQHENKLLTILGRRRFPDGNLMLQTLHDSQRLLRVPTVDVIMTPDNSHHMQLDELNRRIKVYHQGPTLEEAAITEKAAPRTTISPTEQNRQIENAQNKTQKAKLLILEADAIERQAAIDAGNRREKAYVIDPALRPSSNREADFDFESAMDSSEDLLSLLEGDDVGPFVDQVTGKEYKTEATLKAAITRREKASKK
jgi:hypothetical protein